MTRLRGTAESLLAVAVALVLLGCSDPGTSIVVTSETLLRRAHDVRIQQTYAQVASKGAGEVRTPGKNGCLTLIELSNPRAPKIAGAICGLDDAQAVVPQGALSFVASASAFHAIDVSKPTEPLLKATVALPQGTSINEIILHNGTALCADKSGFVHILDVQRPSAPQLLGSVDTRQRGGLDSPHDLAVHGRRVYVVDQQGTSSTTNLQAYDAFNERGEPLPPERWEPVWSYRDPALAWANRMEIAAGFLYVGFNTVHVFDLREPQRVRLVTVAETPIARITGMRVHRQHLLVAGDAHVQVFDISEPERIRPLHLLADPQTLLVRHGQGAHGLDVLTTADGSRWVTVTSQGTHALVIFRLPDS